jgi:uncharacterized membrane protein
MWRVLKSMFGASLIVVVALLSFVFVDMATAPGTGGSSPAAINGFVAGALGLGLGLLIARVRRWRWRMIPVVLRLWRRRLSQEFWWMAAGSMAAAVLIFY